MCLATPAKIKKVKGRWAEVVTSSHTHKVNLDLIKNPKVGDYVLVHCDLAINKVAKKEAEKILKIIKNNKNHHE